MQVGRDLLYFRLIRSKLILLVVKEEQYNLAKTAFDAQSSKLNELYTSKVPALEKEFEDVGGILFNNQPARRRFEEKY